MSRSYGKANNANNGYINSYENKFSLDLDKNFELFEKDVKVFTAITGTAANMALSALTPPYVHILS